MSEALELEIIEGPESGKRFAVQAGTYRVLGRAGDDVQFTVQMTMDGDRLLDAQQEELVETLFRKRGSRGLRTRFRKRGADILVHDESVSRTHALVFADPEGISVADLMSTNGTTVNGQSVADADIAYGDCIRIGHSTFKLRKTDGQSGLTG